LQDLFIIKYTCSFAVKESNSPLHMLRDTKEKLVPEILEMFYFGIIDPYQA
jgi:hypothetical protein